VFTRHFPNNKYKITLRRSKCSPFYT